MPSGLVDRPEELAGMVVEAATVVVEAAKVLVVEAGEKAEAAPKLRPVTKNQYELYLTIHIFVVSYLI